MNLKVYQTINTVFGSLVLLDGLYWAATIYYPFAPALLWQMFSGYNPNAIDTQLVGFPLGVKILPILPISIVILGVFMLALNKTQTKLAIPLWLMGCGAFDILGDTDPNVISRVIGGVQAPGDPGSFWVFFQLALMFGGWFLAGMPRFKANWWLGLLIIMLVLSPGFGGDGRPLEISLFAYIAVSTIPNLWGKNP